MRLAVIFVTLFVSLAYGGGISYGHWITAALADVGVNTGSLSVVVEDPNTEFDFTCETHLFPRHALSFVRFWASDQTPGKLTSGKPGAVKIEEDGNEVSAGYSVDPPDAAIGDPAVVHLGTATVTITGWIENPGEPGEYLGFTYVLDGDPVVVDVKAGRGIWRTTFDGSGLWSRDGMCDPTARPLHFCQPSTIESIIPITNEGSVPATPYVALGPATQCELFDATLETTSGVLAAGPLCDLLDQPYQIIEQLDPGDSTFVTLSISLADSELEPGEYNADLTVTGFVTQWNFPLENADLGWTAASDLPLSLTVTVEPPDFGYGDCENDDECEGDECDDDGGKKGKKGAAEEVDPAAGDAEAAPAEENPPEEPLAEEPPAEEPPLEEAPPEEPPADTPPEEPPVEELPVEEPPLEEAPLEEPPADTPPGEPPVEELPAEEPPGEEPPIDDPAGVDVQRASLAGLVWHDLDDDRLTILGGPENGLAGVEVVLLDEDGLESEVVETMANGFYTFPDIEPGTYTVGFYPPDGYGFAEFTEPAESFDTPEDYEIFLAGLADELDVEPDEIVLSDLVAVDEQSGPLIGLTAPVVLVDGENLGLGDAALIEVEEPETPEEPGAEEELAEPIEIPSPPAEPSDPDEGETSISPANPDGDAKEPEPDPVEEASVGPADPDGDANEPEPDPVEDTDPIEPLPDPVDETDPSEPEPEPPDESDPAEPAEDTSGDDPVDQEVSEDPPADPAEGETTP